MLEFYKRRRLKRYLYSPLVLVPLGFVVVWAAFGVWDVYTKERETREKRAERTEELHALEARASALQEEIDALSTERGREAEVRERFEVAREGEQVIVIVDPKEEPAEEAPPPEKSWWQKILDWF